MNLSGRKWCLSGCCDTSDCEQDKGLFWATSFLYISKFCSDDFFYLFHAVYEHKCFLVCIHQLMSFFLSICLAISVSALNMLLWTVILSFSFEKCHYFNWSGYECICGHISVNYWQKINRNVLSWFCLSSKNQSLKFEIEVWDGM